MQTPSVIGRSFPNIPGEKSHKEARAPTSRGPSVSIPFELHDFGSSKVETFISLDVEDRGGIVLRLQIDSTGLSFLPTAIEIDDGIEIHIAGEVEAETFVSALRLALDAIRI